MGVCASDEKPPPYPMVIAPGLRVFEQLDEVLYRVAVPFRLANGLVDTFTHMALVRLQSGKFVALATVDVHGPAKTQEGGDTELGLIKQDIDTLTENGALLEAVVATHSFHTLAYPSFYKAYPNAKYYGTPRHLRNQPEIPWAGVVTDCSVRELWAPEIRFAIPPEAVGEFADPENPATNHWNSVLVLAGRTLFNDDMIMYQIHPKQLMGRLFVWVAGLSGHEKLDWHGSMFRGGLRQNAEAPGLFLEWIEGVLAEWDFDIIATAHNGVLKRNGKQRLIQLVNETKPKLQHMAEKWAKGETEPIDPNDPSKSGGWSNNPREQECG